jgi:hypothetical protein
MQKNSNTLYSPKTYEIKLTRSEHKIPVVDGVHLHSSYNPIKEALSLVEKHRTQLDTKNEVLILGLGFGYHVNEIISHLDKMHNGEFKVVVIEPNTQVYHDCLKLNLLHKKNVVVYSGYLSKDLYQDLDLVNFLLRKPSVIAHPPTFNLYSAYFKEVLTFEASPKIEHMIEFISDKSLKAYLNELEPHTTLETFLYEDLPKRTIHQGLDFLMMALGEMNKKSLTINKSSHQRQ